MAVRDIHPSIAALDIVCAETPAPPTALVVFGASGDLVHRKLIPSLAQLREQGLLSEHFCLLGCGRTEYSDEQFRDSVRKALEQSTPTVTPETISTFVRQCYYVSGSYDDPTLYDRMKARLAEIRDEQRIDGCNVFYLSVPPALYPVIVEHLGQAGLSGANASDPTQCARLVVEKPFGRDVRTAIELNDVLVKWFSETQIYRIDHYLGKETVQNIMIFRFANAIFEPVWNRNHIDNIQITIAETLGVEHRASYYDKSGALRDMFQNHMLQMVALIAMEPPISFHADRIHDEKVKLLRSIRPLATDVCKRTFVRGQYTSGKIGDQDVPAYRSERNVASDSTTETFVAARLLVDNWRWKDVPFYLRTGKRLAAKRTEIAVTFRQVPHSLFASVGLEEMPPNVLVFTIQPEEGISLRFQAKQPGSKICMGTLNMSFGYRDVFHVDMPESYQRLLLDCMVGDQTLFARFDGVVAAWELLDPLLEAWTLDKTALPEYPAGCESFPEADALLGTDSRQWRPLSVLEQ